MNLGWYFEAPAVGIRSSQSLPGAVEDHRKKTRLGAEYVAVFSLNSSFSSHRDTSSREFAVSLQHGVSNSNLIWLDVPDGAVD